MTHIVPNVLTIAGSDPSGGAGIQADLRSFAALGVHGCAIPAALTAQNTMEVSAVFAVPHEFLRQQIDVLFADIRVDALKIGMLGSAGAVRVVAESLGRYQPPFVVLDPVLRASTGASLLQAEALAVFRDELMPLATLVTPNAQEAGALLGRAAPRSIAEARDAAQLLVNLGARAALVTGGHLDSADVCVDVLHDGSMLHEWHVPREHVADTHGTGCTLSAAIAALLARGLALTEACREAQLFVAESIRLAPELSVGKGAGPVHQLGAMWHAAGLVRDG